MEEVEEYVKNLNEKLEQHNKQDKSNYIMYEMYRDCKKYKLKDMQKYQDKYDLKIMKAIHSPTANEDYCIQQQGGIAYCRPDNELYLQFLEEQNLTKKSN